MSGPAGPRGREALAIAVEFLEDLSDRETARRVRPGTRHFGIFLGLRRATGATAGPVANAYHAALAIEHECEWVTNDTGFARFPGLRWRSPTPSPHG